MRTGCHILSSVYENWKRKGRGKEEMREKNERYIFDSVCELCGTRRLVGIGTIVLVRGTILDRNEILVPHPGQLRSNGLTNRLERPARLVVDKVTIRQCGRPPDGLTTAIRTLIEVVAQNETDNTVGLQPRGECLPRNFCNQPGFSPGEPCPRPRSRGRFQLPRCSRRGLRPSKQ